MERCFAGGGRVVVDVAIWGGSLSGLSAPLGRIESNRSPE